MRTHTRASAVAAAMVLATFVSGCSDDGSGPGPIRPTPPTQGPPAAPPPPGPSPTLNTLSGVVFEVTSAGNTPVEGVEVYCEPCGPPEGHSARHTDVNGVFVFQGAGGVAAGPIELLLAKRGYMLPDQPDQAGPSGNSWMGAVTVTVTGDTRHDIRIVRKQ